MALRFNPPPNWPAPPEGFVPPAGWQPDPAWGPAPEGWQLWVDDSIPENSGTGLAPTQVISTGSPVANPSSPSIGSAPGLGAPGPVAGSAPSFGASAPSVGSAPAPAMATSVGSAPSASPYAANLDYAQAPTPYHSSPAQPAGWQPVDVPGASPTASTPVTKQWWFWAIIVAVVVAIIAVIALAVTLSGDDKGSSSSSGPTPAATSAATEDHKTEPTGSGDPSDKPAPKQTPTSAASGAAPSKKAGSGEAGTTRDNPIDPTTTGLTLHASKYEDDPDATIDVTFGAVNWNANDELKEADKYSYKDPGADKVYIRLPVTVTYHGKGQMRSSNVKIDYVAENGSSYRREYSFTKDSFDSVDMPRDGGTATGYFTYVIPTSDVNKGVFAVKGFFGSDEVYVQAK